MHKGSSAKEGEAKREEEKGEINKKTNKFRSQKLFSSELSPIFFDLVKSFVLFFCFKQFFFRFQNSRYLSFSSL